LEAAICLRMRSSSLLEHSLTIGELGLKIYGPKLYTEFLCCFTH